MEKQVITWHGRKYYLLGVDENGDKYFLVEPSWDCGWYWGFGYIVTFTNKRNPEKSRDIKSWSHFDNEFLDSSKGDAYTLFNNLLKDSTVDHSHLFELVDYMMSYYTLSKAAALFRRRYSYQTERARLDLIDRKDYEDEINKKMLPALFAKIKQLLSPNSDED